MGGNQVTSVGLDQQQGLYEDGMQYIGSEFTKSLLPMIKTGSWDFPGGLVVKNPPASTGDTGLIPGPGRSHLLWDDQAHAPQLPSQCAQSLCSTRETITARRSHTTRRSSPHRHNWRKPEHSKEDPPQPKVNE